MVNKPTTLSAIGAAAVALTAAFTSERIAPAAGFSFVQQPRGTSTLSPSTAAYSHRGSSTPLHMSLFDWGNKGGDDKSSNKNDADSSSSGNGDGSGESSVRRGISFDQYNRHEFPLPNDMSIPETRQLRWDREAELQSEFASGDELFDARQRIAEAKAEIRQARLDFNEASGEEEKYDANRRIHLLQKELRALNERDAEFIYAMSRELMEKAIEAGDDEAAERHRVRMEEARICVPQLNMHGLWVGK